MFPELKGKLNGHAIRVPMLNASLTDMVFNVKTPTTAAAVNAMLEKASGAAGTHGLAATAEHGAILGVAAGSKPRPDLGVGSAPQDQLPPPELRPRPHHPERRFSSSGASWGPMEPRPCRAQDEISPFRTYSLVGYHGALAVRRSRRGFAISNVQPRGLPWSPGRAAAPKTRLLHFERTGFETLPLVSTDYVNDVRSSVVDAASTMVVGGSTAC